MPAVKGDRDDLVDRALATGDEHAIKFTEACLREYALNPKPLYLRQAPPLPGSAEIALSRRERVGVGGIYRIPVAR